MSKPKTMSRSRNQIATSYAPESFFTFEGGLGACLAKSAVGGRPDLSDSTQRLIFERIDELGRAWFDAAMAARAGDPTKPQPLARQCVDVNLLSRDGSGFQVPGADSFYLSRPSTMGYTPAPLSFVCRTCGLFRDYESLAKLDADLPKLTPEACQDPKKKGGCEWEQVDVIFVHWSGRWERPFPGQHHWSHADSKVNTIRSRCVCGSEDFRLNRRAAGIGDWFFVCARCDTALSSKWLQNDPDTLAVLGAANDASRLTDVRMQATPYRASSAYYVKADLFIDFKDSSQQLLDRLRPGHESDLEGFVATTYGFAVAPITDDDVRAALGSRPDLVNELAEFENTCRTIAETEAGFSALPDAAKGLVSSLLEQARKRRSDTISSLRERSILVPTIELPADVARNLRNRRSNFASKFDPFRLSIEHAALKQTKLDVDRLSGGKRPYVSFTRLDDDLAPDDDAEKAALQLETRTLLDELGLDDMGMIREFDLCRFSFGYSRMESGPVLPDKRGLPMPVRLNLFPKVQLQESGAKHPIYVIQQSNEAIYVRLKERRVLDWLARLGCDDLRLPNPGERAGAAILAMAREMTPFLDHLPKTEHPPAYYYLYTLLHSYAHLLMKHVAEYSGLDLGSLGEYIFPADLAFVVYRNGTTMDLGNVSALWRNSGTSLLRAMTQPKAVLCGTGSLCAERGGACPDCLMVPETSCIAGNKLLSRTALRSVGGRPRFDTRRGAGAVGYLDCAAGNTSAS